MKIGQWIFSLTAFLVLLPLKMHGAFPLNYCVSLTGGGGDGEFSPYYISSLQGGRFTQRDNLLTELSVCKSIDTTEKFSYGFGLDVVGGYASEVKYDRYDISASSMVKHSERPSSFWLQQVYGDIKWRSIFVSAGVKERGSVLLNNTLTSGDLTESGNARPIPQIRAGLIDFWDIPYTNGWVQINGEAGYGIFLDDNWWKDHYNYYNYHITRKVYYNYKRFYFRTKPSKKFSVTIGMQAAAKFGGITDYYYKGKLQRTERFKSDLFTFAKMMLPIQDGGETFYTGNHIGSWDMRARYTLRDGKQLFAYFSFPWEDGSGIGKLNGWDGLWGLEYRASEPSIINAALFEYLDFTNQSGPLHFNPSDFAGTTLTDHVSGSDDYYNNTGHNSYAYYGMSVGTPALMAPIYNTDGYMGYVANAMRGFHIGVEGDFSDCLSYRVKGGYRKAWGNGYFLLPRPLHLSAVMIEVNWRPMQFKGLSLNGKIELDRGTMPCNAFGAMLTIRYDGIFKL